MFCLASVSNHGIFLDAWHIPKLFKTKDSIKKEEFLKLHLGAEVLVTYCHVCPDLYWILCCRVLCLLTHFCSNTSQQSPGPEFFTLLFQYFAVDISGRCMSLLSDKDGRIVTVSGISMD